MAEFGSGVGDPNDEYVRFGLGAIFFVVLLVISLRNRKGALRDRETILAIGFGLGLSREVFKFVIKSLETHGGVETATLELFFPPLEHALFALSRVFIAAGFIHFFLDARRLSARFLVVGTALTLGFYAVAAPVWWSIVAETPTAKFSHFIGDWVIHGLGVALGAFVVVLFLRSDKRGHLIVSAVFLAFLLDDILQLINLGTGEVYKSVFAPIRHNLHIWGIFALGFVYFRELSAEKQRLEEQLHNRERLNAVGQLAAGVAHDFNNILQVVLGFTEVARERGSDYEDALNQIEGAGNRGAKLVSQLLTYSRQDRVVVGQCRVDATIAGMSGMFQNLLGPQIALRLHLNAPEAYVNISDSRLEQVVVNLLVNARDAMPEGGEVTIRTGPDRVNLEDTILGTGARDVVRIEVSDTGEGMSDVTLPQVFTPFFTTKGLGKGTGLGLASVQGIVARAGGTVEAKSKSGHGATITIHLPLVEEMAETEVEAPTKAAQPGSETILLAEDESALADLFSAYLRRAGYTVLTARNGAEALELAMENGKNIDLCLFDIAMPEMTGYRAYTRLLDAGGEIPVIFMTGNVVSIDSRTTMYPHIVKPFDRNSLLNLVREQLDR